MKTLCVVQARSSSTRLPNKVLMKILGKSMILRQLERLGRAKFIDETILATSTDPSDDELTLVCRNAGYTVFRGSLSDVLDRFYMASLDSDCTHIVRITGDCPLIDPEVVDGTINQNLKSGLDYTSNALSPMFPDGLDVEIFKREVLKICWDQSTLPSERENVTPYIYNNPDKFTLENFSSDTNLSHLRWTVDEPADFEFVTAIYERLYALKPDFVMSDILEIPQLEGLSRLNSGIGRNEGYLKSLEDDEQFLELRKSDE